MAQIRRLGSNEVPKPRGLPNHVSRRARCPSLHSVQLHKKSNGPGFRPPSNSTLGGGRLTLASSGGDRSCLPFGGKAPVSPTSFLVPTSKS